MRIRSVLLVAFALLAVGAGDAAPPPIAAGRLGQVAVFRPEGPPDAVVFLFSGAAGFTEPLAAEARALAGDGIAVVGVASPGYLEALRASDDGCHYLVSEIEDLSKRVQRDLGATAYHSPILAGVGEGATLAYGALAQAPAATVAGAVCVDPVPVLPTRVPLCPGAVSHAAPGGFRYDAKPDLPGFLRVSPGSASPPAWAVGTAAADAPAAGPAATRLAAAVRAAAGPERPAASAEDRALAGLPLVELPADPDPARPGAPTPRTLAVVYSGDGGWRDLDKEIAEDLAARGIPVIGVDTLRYFWSERPPQQIADELAAILEEYTARWHADRVLLVGYSFGANVLPFAVNRLPAALRARVAQVTLLAPELRAQFEFHVTGWLEAAGVHVEPEDAPELLPELLRLDTPRLQCVYGEEEEESPCRSPRLPAVERIAIRGGHHFDGDYPALATRILAGLAGPPTRSGPLAAQPGAAAP